MTTLTVNSNSAEALKFIEYAQSFPFVSVAEEPVVRFKPSVERSMRRSAKGKDRVAFDNVEDFFKDLGI